METKQFTRNIRDDFNRTFSLVAVIPLLVFIYLILGKLANFNLLAGEIGYIIMATICVFISGIMFGRKMLMSITLRLIEDNQKILAMQNELIAKNRLAAITETVLTLWDQVNNPLLVISGNLEMLDAEIKHLEIDGKIHDRFQTMRSNIRKIREVTDKMSKLTKIELVTIRDYTRMIDLNKSK